MKPTLKNHIRRCGKFQGGAVLIGLMIFLPGFIARAALQVEIHAFPNADFLPAGLVQGADGNFYGTMHQAGSSGNGAVFRVTPNGAFTNLVCFNGTNGMDPKSRLTLGTDGNFYGVTQSGGTNNAGTVFQLTPSGTLTTLVQFNNSNGASPFGELVQGTDGNFYGTTQSGGAGNYGTVFQVTSSGVLTMLASFTGANSSFPTGKLLQWADGNYYGTTFTGGRFGFGTVFRVTTNGALTTLVSFNGINGFGPQAGLTLGGDGNFYGTTVGGGTNGFGTIFQVTPSGTLTSLVSFNGANGSGPDSPLLLAADGNLYGTTESSLPGGNGTVFKLALNGTLTTLANLNSTEGANPHAGLLLGADGNYYGTTEYGGTNNYGTVFQLTAAGTFTTLATFNFTNGAYPAAGLALGSNNVFYGTTCDGGTSNLGTIFSLTSGGALTTLVSFNSTNGSYPYGGLVLGTNGLFYGTTFRGGSNDCGTVFQMDTNGVLTSLVSFNSINGNGYYPATGLVLGADGNFYGVTSIGGTNYDGTTFKMTHAGVLSSVAAFSYNQNGIPVAPLVQGNNGNLYGSSTYGNGTIFNVTPTGTQTTLYTFSGSDGSSPTVGLVQGTDGNFYGSTFYGGVSEQGVVFQMTPSGSLTDLLSFNEVNGSGPDAELVQGATGNFYGTTSSGGSDGGGNIYLLMTNNSSIAPVIIFQPANQTVLVGNTATFNVLAGGTPPLSYQWQFNGTNLVGATGTTLMLNNVQLAQAGNYSVAVSNTAGLMISSNAVLMVQDAPPVIIVQPSNQAVAAGSTAIFNVQVAGSLPLICQWSCNGTNLNGTTNASLVLNNVQLAQAGNYTVAVSNLLGSTVSSNALLTVNPVPVFIAVSPVSQEVLVGSTVTLETMAGGTSPLAYQWSCNGTNLVWATNTVLTISSIQPAQAGNYAVVVTNNYGSVTSQVATLLVGIITATTQPASQTNLPGTAVSFSVAVNGTGPFTYQWQFNGTNLPNNIINTVAGNGTNSYSGDGSAATNAGLYYPTSVAFDALGNLYIADQYNNRIRMVATNGIISTVAGNGSTAYVGNGGAATNAGLYRPFGVAFDAFGNLYIADQYHHRIRKVDTNGIITTVAGNGSATFTGDGGKATSASLDYPTSVAFDAFGNLFIADQNNNRIRKVDIYGIISTVAGNGNSGYAGDGGEATRAEIWHPNGVAFDAADNLYIADQYNNRIRKVNGDDIITTVAGNGSATYAGDGGKATSASLYYPTSVAFDALGNLYIADQYNNRIRMVATNGIITTVAGNGSATYAGDGGKATSASLHYPTSVVFDASGNLYISDQYNNRIREVASNPTLTLNNIGATNAGNYTVVISSSYGSVTSAVATLTEPIPPVIITQPSSQQAGVGSSPSFSITVAGSGPFVYAWYFAATNQVQSGTNSMLMLSNVSTNNTGNYTVVVTNNYGSVTSAVATLTVTIPRTPPQIVNSGAGFGFLTNQFGFNISGAFGQTIVVDGSTDLVNWIPLITNTAGNNPIYFFDPASTNFVWRFYRARLP